MKKSKVLKMLNKHLSDTNTSESYNVRPRFNFKLKGKDCSISIQASEYAYSNPRKDSEEVYQEVELGYPDFDFTDSFINKYAEDKGNPKDSIYGYVPLKELAEELSTLGKKKKKVYTKVRLIVHDNTIFIIDSEDRDNYVAIAPEAWEHIKENIDQQIADGYLENTDEH